MDKALEMAKTSATGSLKLSLGLATSTVITAVKTIILAGPLSPEEYGHDYGADVPPPVWS